MPPNPGGGASAPKPGGDAGRAAAGAATAGAATAATGGAALALDAVLGPKPSSAMKSLSADADPVPTAATDAGGSGFVGAAGAAPRVGAAAAPVFAGDAAGATGFGEKQSVHAATSLLFSLQRQTAHIHVVAAASVGAAANAGAAAAAAARSCCRGAGASSPYFCSGSGTTVGCEEAAATARRGRGVSHITHAARFASSPS